MARTSVRVIHSRTYSTEFFLFYQSIASYPSHTDEKQRLHQASILLIARWQRGTFGRALFLKAELSRSASPWTL